MQTACFIGKMGSDFGVQVFDDGMPIFAAVNLADLIRRDGPDFVMATLYATGSWRSINPSLECLDDPDGNVPGYGSFFSGEPRNLERCGFSHVQYSYEVAADGVITVSAFGSRLQKATVLGTIDPLSDSVVDDLVDVIRADTNTNYPDPDFVRSYFSDRFALSLERRKKQGCEIRPLVIDKFACLGWFDVVENLFQTIDPTDLDHNDPFQHAYNAYRAGVPIQDIYF